MKKKFRIGDIVNWGNKNISNLSFGVVVSVYDDASPHLVFWLYSELVGVANRTISFQDTIVLVRHYDHKEWRSNDKG